MPVCGTPDCGEQSVGYYRSQRTQKMAQMCVYCKKRRDESEPRLKPGVVPQPSAGKGLQMVLAGSLNHYDWREETAFFNTVLHGADGNLETIWNGRSAYHRTQPRTNLTVVYTRNDQTMTIIGIGNHIGNGNNSYSIQFDDGGRRRCERR